MKSVLLDSDVLMDVYLNRLPFADSSAELLSRCENGALTGFVTPLTLSNCYYLLRKVSSHRFVIEQFESLLEFVKIATISESAVSRALKSSFNDFEDALQHFSAVENPTIYAIITRNGRDFSRSAIPPSRFIRLRCL